MDVIDDGQGNIIVTDGGVQKLVTSVEAIASWGELLGIGDSTLVVQAMMQAKDPGIVDAATARNAWTSAFEQCERDLLEDHNQTRRLALKRAYTATGALSPDGRAETRRLLGLDDSLASTTSTWLRPPKMTLATRWLRYAKHCPRPTSRTGSPGRATGSPTASPSTHCHSGDIDPSQAIRFPKAPHDTRRAGSSHTRNQTE